MEAVICYHKHLMFIFIRLSSSFLYGHGLVTASYANANANEILLLANRTSDGLVSHRGGFVY